MASKEEFVKALNNVLDNPSDEDNKDIEEEVSQDFFTLDLSADEEADNNQEIESDKEYDIEIKLQEKYVRLDQLEIKLASDDYSDEEYNEYYELKQEIKTLEKEKRLAKKIKKSTEEKGILEQVSVWIIIYGIVMTILCLPGISQTIWFGFSSVLLDTFSFFDKVSMDDGALYYIWLFILAYAIPLLLHLLSWELYINFVKTKVNKWAFRIVWIIQAILTVAMIVYSIVELHLFG